MTVKEVLAGAADCLGREDLLAVLDKEEEELAEEEKKEWYALLRAYNFVENETALDYCALKAEETVGVTENCIFYNEFSKKPVYIHKVYCGGALARFATFSAYIRLPDGWLGKARVVFDYLPSTKTELGEESEFTGTGVSARLLSYGVAAQYCLVNGETGNAAIWDKKYRDALRAANLFKRTLSVRSRRWV